jgi:hypothetical protein
VGQDRRWGTRGQGGFTLLEGVICVAITAVGLMAVALGLLTSTKVDNQANDLQRLNLATRSFTESTSFSRPPVGTPCGSTSPPPSTVTLGSAAPSHAKLLLQSAVGRGDLDRWIDQRVVFTVTDVEYGQSSGTAQEQFIAASALATCPAPVAPAPSYPVIRISVRVCRGGEVGGASVCDPSSPVVDAQVIERGGRTAQ